MQKLLQQSTAAWQCPPTGLQPPALVHILPVHIPEQQSVPAPHALPSDLQTQGPVAFRFAGQVELYLVLKMFPETLCNVGAPRHLMSKYPLLQIVLLVNDEILRGTETLCSNIPYMLEFLISLSENSALPPEYIKIPYWLLLILFLVIVLLLLASYTPVSEPKIILSDKITDE